MKYPYSQKNVKDPISIMTTARTIVILKHALVLENLKTALLPQSAYPLAVVLRDIIETRTTFVYQKRTVVSKITINRNWS